MVWDDAKKIFEGKKYEDWYPVETFKLEENSAYANLWNTIFDEKTSNFMQRFNVGGYSMDLFVSIVEGKLDFGISCDCNDPNSWISDNNLNNCLEKAKKWFKENR